ncbi:MAG: hypothetical protein WAL56_24825, partial [Candidatus Sulfotelmatobacter sp.]
MTKSLKFSAVAAFAALLCFATSAFGENVAKDSAVRPGEKIVNHQLGARDNDSGWGDQGWG